MPHLANGEHLLSIQGNLSSGARTVQIVTKHLFSMLNTANVVKGSSMWMMMFDARVVQRKEFRGVEEKCDT